MAALLQTVGLPGGYGAVLLEALISLGAVCLLAWVLLRWASRLRIHGRGGTLQVLERVPLDARRSLVLVRVGESVLLLGLGEGAAPRLLIELSPDVLEGLGEGAESAGRRSFADVLAGLRGTDTGGRGEADPEEPKEPEAQLR